MRISRSMTRYTVAFLFAFSIGCGDDDTATEDAAADTTSDDTAADATPEDLLSGIYNVETVTCGGEVTPIMVTAKVTFDGASYLEEWTFADNDCEVTLAGTVESTGDEVTLVDVDVTCGAACGAFCDPTHCSADQVYQYTRTGDELLLSFTQQGDEFSCGPCGDGVASTYLLRETP